MGLAYDTLGQYDRAVKAFDQVLKHDQTKFHVWYNRGISLFRLGHYAEAVRSFDRVMEKRRDGSVKWVGTGSDLILFNRDESAATQKKPATYDARDRVMLTIAASHSCISAATRRQRRVLPACSRSNPGTSACW